MLRLADDGVGRAFLYDPSEVHDGDAIGEVGGRRQIVRDHEDREISVAAQVTQERENASSHGYIQHRHRLVSYQQLRVKDDACRDGHPLALTTGQLMRESVQVLLKGLSPARASITHAAGTFFLRSPMP